MPFKHNAARRHRIPKARYRVQNWPAYEAGLKRRGDLTLWLDEAAIAGWKAPRRTTPGGQAWYSDAAIEPVLMLRLVFHLALRQAEGFAASVLRLLGQELRVPDHTTLMWTATGSQADFVFTPAPCGASQANRRFAPGVGGPCSLVRRPKRKPNPCRPSSQDSKQPRRPSRTPVRVAERSGQVRPYVRPVARPMPLAIMGVRSRARHQSERRARGAAESAVSPGLSRPQPFPSRRSALPAGSAGAGPLSALLHRAPERHAVAPAATAARPFAR